MAKQKPPRMHAPGLIYAPEHKNNSRTILVVVLILFLSLTACMCNYVLHMNMWTSDPGTVQTNETIGIALYTSPIWGALLFFFLKLWLASRKKSPQDVLIEAQEYIEEAEYRRQQSAAADISRTPKAIKGSSGTLGAIGVPIIGDLAWCCNGWFTLPAPELAKHGVVVGGSGTGKTVSLMRLAYIAARIYGYRVYFLDGKGDRDTAAQFIATMHQAGIQTAMLPRQPFDGWKGNGTAILNRLMAVLDFTEPYYEDAARDTLTAVCIQHPSGPPTSSRDLLARLNTILKQNPQSRTIEGVVLRYRSFFGALAGALDNGFSFEDTNAAYMLLDGLALKKQAASLGRFLIEDFAHYAAKRKQPGRDLLIIDEYSAISTGADAANLIERIRSYNCAVVLSSQSYAGLGEERDAERILDAANWLLLHRTAAPERLTARAGTAQQLKEMRQFGGSLDDQVFEPGRAQMQEEHALHPDQARRLQIGQALMIAHGRFIKAQIAPAPAPDPAIVDQARAWIDDEPEPPAIQAPAPQIHTTPARQVAQPSAPAPAPAIYRAPQAPTPPPAP